MAKNANDETTTQMDDSIHKADRTRKNAIKQMRTTATKLKNSTAESDPAVRDHAAQIAQNLYEIADFLDTLTVDQTMPILPEPEVIEREVVVQAKSQPDTSPASKPSPKSATPVAEDELVIAFTPQQLATGAAFIVGMFVGLFLRRK